jgi:hypothetical protein
VDDLIRVAKQADSSSRGALAESLDLSNRTLDPLADPLATEFGAHRWLSSEREEAYSDWFGWILEQIGDAGLVLRLLGVRDRELLRVCGSEKPFINREFKIPDGRPDLVVEFGKRLLVIVEIKTKSFDLVAVRDQLARYARWIPDPRNPPQRTLRYFAAVEFGEFDSLSTFEPLPWRELTLRMREQARPRCGCAGGGGVLDNGDCEPGVRLTVEATLEEINIEFGMPTVDVAMPLLNERLRSLKKSGVKAVKIIHGYGSTGKGGRLRKATLLLLDELKKSELIRVSLRKSISRSFMTAGS